MIIDQVKSALSKSIWAYLPHGYKQIDIKNDPVNPDKWRDKFIDGHKTAVQVPTGLDIEWVNGNGYGSPEMQIKSSAFLPSSEQRAPFATDLSGYKGVDMDEPDLFTYKIFAPNAKFNIDVSLDRPIYLDAGSYRLWVWVYNHLVKDGQVKPDAFNHGIFEVSLYANEHGNETVLENGQDSFVELSFDVDEAQYFDINFFFESNYPEAAKDNQSLFVKAMGLELIELQELPEPESYEVVVQLFSQKPDDLTDLITEAIKKRRTVTFSIDDALRLVSNPLALPASRIEVFGWVSDSDLRILTESGYNIVLKYA